MTKIFGAKIRCFFCYYFFENFKSFKLGYNSETDFWNELVDEMIKQGFAIGIKLEIPKSNDMIDFPEYEETAKKC